MAAHRAAIFHGAIDFGTGSGMASRMPRLHNRPTPTARHAVMRPARLALLAPALVAALDASASVPLPTPAELAVVAAQVRAAEIAFAKTMADRRLDQFGEFVAEDAVFNGSGPHVGRAAVVESWKGYFKDAQAPFSWAPAAGAPTADGRTAISTGLARAPDGNVISRFTSLWRKDADGHWRVIVDQGVEQSACVAQAGSSAAIARRPEAHSRPQ